MSLREIIEDVNPKNILWKMEFSTPRSGVFTSNKF
jgi:hypothetical protein